MERPQMSNSAEIMSGSKYYSLPDDWEIVENSPHHTSTSSRCVYESSDGVQIAVYDEPNNNSGRWLVHSGRGITDADIKSLEHPQVFAERYSERFSAENCIFQLYQLIEL